jgi:pimeloyl-ACP methyl ester carboxylesterase
LSRRSPVLTALAHCGVWWNRTVTESSQDERLASRTVGTDGPRVVFVHGLFGQGKNWTTIAKALADRHRVTLIDLPNHGHSPWTDTVDYVDMAELLAAEVESYGEPVTLVGHSMGGKVAMTLALRRPELVRALVVVDIAPVEYPVSGGRTDDPDEEASPFADYIAAMKALDLTALDRREDADEALRSAVPSRMVRGFLLQSLVREGLGSGGGWRWRLNLDLLERDLERLRGFPEPPPGAHDAAGADQERRSLGALRAAGDLHRDPAAVPRPRRGPARLIASAPTFDGEDGMGLRRLVTRAVTVLLAVGTTTALAVTPAAAVAHGAAAAPGQFPYAVKLTMTAIPRPNGTSYNSGCSAALISRTWILTAGHCFHDVNGVRVSGATPYRTTATLNTANTTTSPGETRDVVEVRQAPTGADVALARLSAPVTDVAPLPLNTQRPVAGQILTIAGWSATSSVAPAPSPQLYSGQVRITSVATSTVLVTGYAPARDTSACLYDSGAPYLAASPARLVSVESTGPNCPHAQNETTARVDPLVPWVRSVATDVR